MQYLFSHAAHCPALQAVTSVRCHGNQIAAMYGIRSLYCTAVFCLFDQGFSNIWMVDHRCGDCEMKVCQSTLEQSIRYASQVCFCLLSRLFNQTCVDVSLVPQLIVVGREINNSHQVQRTLCWKCQRCYKISG